jgi:hypothetical protein
MILRPFQEALTDVFAGIFVAGPSKDLEPASITETTTAMTANMR